MDREPVADHQRLFETLFDPIRQPVLVAPTVVFSETPDVRTASQAYVRDVMGGVRELLGMVDALRDPEVRAFDALASIDLGRPAPDRVWHDVCSAPGLQDDMRHCLDRVVGPHIPTVNAVDAVCRFARGSQVVVYGERTGYWSHLLAQGGASVAATCVDAPCGPRDMRWVDIRQASLRDTVPFADGAPTRRTTIVVDHGARDDLAIHLHSMDAGERLVMVDPSRVADGVGFTGRMLMDRFHEVQSIELPRWEGQAGIARMYRCGRSAA